MNIQRINRSTYQLKTTQMLPRPLEEVFEFFSRAANLETITPPLIRFHILTPDVKMKVGAQIDYKLKLKGVPIRWRSEIPVWNPPYKFVDTQVKGPYKKWYHQHLFQPVEGGTLVTDIVDYVVPGGALINRLFVEPDVRKIFAYRHQVLAERFGSVRGGSSKCIASS